ncbi:MULTISPECIES: hypothetical protein [unclassified Psychrobacter]|uniref:hypothetical protein n=1 Tax=unclassified Psychrobacter TaxID=196806 RepID=UPI003FD6598C
MDRTHLDIAYAMLYRIQFMQALAFSAQNELDKTYHIIDYVDTIDDSVKQLQAALDGLERSLAA